MLGIVAGEMRPKWPEYIDFGSGAIDTLFTLSILDDLSSEHHAREGRLERHGGVRQPLVRA